MTQNDTSETNDFYLHFGRRLRQMRNDRGLSQEELGKAAGLSRMTVCNIEFGRQRCMLDTFVRFALCLDADVDQLLPALEWPVPTLEHLAPDERTFVLRALRGTPREIVTDESDSPSQA